MSDSDDRTATFIERRLLVVTRLSLLAVALMVQFGMNGAVIATSPSGVERIVYVALAVVGLACGAALLRSGQIPALVRWPSCVVLLAGSIAMSADLPIDATERSQHWTFGLIGWYGLMLLFDVPLPWVTAFLAIHAVASAAPLLAAGSDSSELVTMGISIVLVSCAQFGVALGARLLRSIAASATRTAGADEQLRLREEAAAAVAQAYEQRYAQLRESTIPLLAGLATGALDPRDATVQHRCAVEAAGMRRLFSQTEDVEDRLVHELGAIIDVAQRHGCTVALSVRGTCDEPPATVRQTLLAPISEALVSARSRARVTVVRTGHMVRISAMCPAPARPITHPVHRGVEIFETVTDGQLWLETSWRSPLQ